MTVAATAGALMMAPLILGAANADAATSFSVSTLHCGGGMHIRAFDNLLDAKSNLHKLVKHQQAAPHSLHSIQLRQGSKVLVKVNQAC